MWINPMLTIWMWGTLAALALIGFSLWRWYWRDVPRPGAEAADLESERSPGQVEAGRRRHG